MFRLPRSLDFVCTSLGEILSRLSFPFGFGSHPVVRREIFGFTGPGAATMNHLRCIRP